MGTIIIAVGIAFSGASASADDSVQHMSNTTATEGSAYVSAAPAYLSHTVITAGQPYVIAVG